MGIGALLGGLSVAALGKRLTLKSVPILFTATGVISIPIALVLLFHIPVMAAYAVMCVCCALLIAFATVGSIQLIVCVQSEIPQELVKSTFMRHGSFYLRTTVRTDHVWIFISVCRNMGCN